MLTGTADLRCSRSRSAPTLRSAPVRCGSPSRPPGSTSPTRWRGSASIPTRRSRPACSATRSPARSSRVGEGVSDPEVGDRVVAGTRFGGQAELVTVPADQALPLPDGLSFEQGAAFAVNYGTAYAALIMMGSLRKGDRVLIHAAAGGVGISATQIARNAGAEIFGTASASKHEAIRAQGVDHPIDYRTLDFEAETMRITGGEGVDLVIDALGPTSFRKDYRLLRSGGRMVMYGLSEGSKDGRRDIPATLKSLVVDADRDHALVEEPADHEREQRGLRPQHAQVVGRRGQPRSGGRAADGRPGSGSPRARSSPRRFPSSAPATRTNSSPSAATSARSCCSLHRRSDPIGGGDDFADEEAPAHLARPPGAAGARGRACHAEDLHGAAGRRRRIEHDPDLAQPGRPRLRDRLGRAARSRRHRLRTPAKATRTSWSADAPSIAGFEVNADGDDDRVGVAKDVTVPVTMRGGPGDDLLLGGAGPDKLFGGERRRPPGRLARRRPALRRSRGRRS